MSTEPRWWVRDVLVAGLVGAIVTAGGLLAQLHFDEQAALRTERLENLRFVRERSSGETTVSRPFSGLDLIGMPLGGLKLAGADFSSANLSGADLQGTDLTGANFDGATLDGAFLFAASLNDAVLTHVSMKETNIPDTDFTGANLVAVDLSSINFGGGSIALPIFGQNCWGDVIWPESITPPPSTCSS